MTEITSSKAVEQIIAAVQKNKSPIRLYGPSTVACVVEAFRQIRQRVSLTILEQTELIATTNYVMHILIVDILGLFGCLPISRPSYQTKVYSRMPIPCPGRPLYPGITIPPTSRSKENVERGMLVHSN